MDSLPYYEQYPLRRCAICGGSARRLLHRHRFLPMEGGSGLLSGYDVVVCASCGFCFADHVPGQSEFDRYYRDMSKYEYGNRDGQISSYDWARFRRIADHLSQVLHSPSDRIFEIGCSTGALLSLLKQRGYQDVTGIDPSPACAEIGKRLYGVPIRTNTLADMGAEVPPVDVLILAGVLEHVRDLTGAIQKCRAMLGETGILYVAVPDASLYATGEDAPFQEFSMEHINFFGPDSLSGLMLRNGFRRLLIDQIMIESNVRTTTPVVIGAFRKADQVPDASLYPDRKTEAGLRLYIDRSNEQAGQIEALIGRVTADGRPIIVWGTGTHTLRLLATGSLGQAHIRAFVDSNPIYRGKQLNGVPIVSPDEIRKWADPILISSRVYQEDIARQIAADLNVTNEVIRLYQYD